MSERDKKDADTSKRPYGPPTLTRYGTVEELTQGATPIVDAIEPGTTKLT
jgi:hypothetical protein